MSEKDIIRYCAPTMAGIKAGSLFACYYETPKELFDEIKDLNLRFSRGGLRVMPLKANNKRALVYFYRPGLLKECLSEKQAEEMLKMRGYPCGSLLGCLVRLVHRLTDMKEFPHEIGLFLGYPPEDVEGFIREKAANSKCVGCWKVYGDKNKAESIFKCYNICKDRYFDLWEQGSSLEELAESVVADFPA